MAPRQELTEKSALEIVQRIRQVNREAAKRFRRGKLKQGYYYLQYWVPEEVKEEARAAVARVVKKAETAREAAGILRRAPKS
ncbi:hypothetical protein UFOVP1287_20 [uncultured Caudovirales phage]|uniref:Uncharacterized protein n=1 Tax=uncultured Caudovirales phage TaxID=2100421 RepID=A0A6J5S8A6_9CAUD|nr:hypothetical protein UFOVP1287_20 [uncultured Caudovirales phage]CAB4205098.1 hypothetical protein UFOVP1408_20 [uncultured Caudovirales phage]